MLHVFNGSEQFQAREFPPTFVDLQESRSKGKLIDFIGFLGINIGYGGDPDLSKLFYLILSETSKGSTGF